MHLLKVCPIFRLVSLQNELSQGTAGIPAWAIPFGGFASGWFWHRQHHDVEVMAGGSLEQEKGKV